MKNGKIDFKSVGITIALAIVGVGIGFYDFFSQKANVMNYLFYNLLIRPVVNTPLVPTTDVVNSMGFAVVPFVIMIVAIVCIGIMLGGVKGMA